MVCCNRQHDWLNNSYLQAMFQLEVDTGRIEAKVLMVLKKSILKPDSLITGYDKTGL
ncbi:MAG: hypothetical protein ACRD8Z_10295 [Nitrososphaeraceae archaeon]